IGDKSGGWRRNWIATRKQKLEKKVMLDAVNSVRFGHSVEDLKWLLRGCDHPSEYYTKPEFRSSADVKGFWRVDRQVHPELRQTVLTVVARADLETLINNSDGGIEEGISKLIGQKGKYSWSLPALLRHTDYGSSHVT